MSSHHVQAPALVPPPPNGHHGRSRSRCCWRRSSGRGRGRCRSQQRRSAGPCRLSGRYQPSLPDHEGWSGNVQLWRPWLRVKGRSVTPPWLQQQQQRRQQQQQQGKGALAPPAASEGRCVRPVIPAWLQQQQQQSWRGRGSTYAACIRGGLLGRAGQLGCSSSSSRRRRRKGGRNICGMH